MRSVGEMTMEFRKAKVEEAKILTEMIGYGHIFSAIVDDQIVGGAILFTDGDVMEIGRIFISPQFHGKGYGLEMMSLIEKMNSKIHTIKLDTPIWNIRTNQF